MNRSDELILAGLVVAVMVVISIGILIEGRVADRRWEHAQGIKQDTIHRAAQKRCR